MQYETCRMITRKQKKNTEYQVAIQTTEGSSEARLAADNSNSWQLQNKMNFDRYIISEPPYLIRNIPKYHITHKLQERQVLKFDIRIPDPGRQLLNRREDASEHANHDCIIETIEQIQKKEKNHPRNIQTNANWTAQNKNGAEKEWGGKKRRTQRN